jgi:hypothetical protein
MLYRGLFDYEQALEQDKFMAEIEMDQTIASETLSRIIGAELLVASVLNMSAKAIKLDPVGFLGLVKFSLEVTANILGVQGFVVTVASMVEAKRNADASYNFVRKLRGDSKILAEDFLIRIPGMDACGLYEGASCTTPRIPSTRPTTPTIPGGGGGGAW